MKEFDIVHHHHQHHQQQQQHHHPHHHQQQQQQHHQSWQSQQQRQQHQTHTTSVYASSTNQQQQQQLGPNHSQSVQRSSINQHQQQQQQNQHAAAQLGQYHHQQLQSTAHHNSAAAAAAYYQQQAPHLYPTYQAHAHSQQQDQQTQQQSQQQSQSQQQQHSASDHSHHHVPVTGSGVAAVVSAAHGVVGQQQHGAPVHHQTPPINTQGATSASLGHAGWSPGVGTMAPPQAHHAVVTDHSTLAYMTHAYQGHNTTVNDPHHRNSNGSMSNQTIGSGPQASSYTVDSLYNTTAAAAAAAVAAYGYNNYNAAFFQTSSNGPHTQTGHPTAANLSTFWNHNQTTQPRTAHTQAVNNQQPTVQQQQRQPITSEQTANYIHDPRIYYGRPTAAYQPNQGVQNFGQTQHHTPPPQQQPQTDLIHHRMNALSQQHQILQHHEQQQLHQVAAHQQPQLHHHSPIGNHQHQSSSNQAQQTLLNQQHSMQHNALLTNQANTLNTHSTQSSRQLASANRVGPQDHQLQKQPSNELESLTPKPQVKNQLDYDQINLTSLSKPTQPMNQLAQQPSQLPTNELETNLTNTQSSLTNAVKDSNQNQQQLQSKLASLSPVSKPQNPQAATTTSIKKDTSPSQQFPKKPPNNNVSQLQSRNLYRAPQQQVQNDRDRMQQQVDTTKRLGNNRDVPPPTLAAGESRSRTSPASSSRGQQDSDQPNSLEDSMASLTVGSTRKTTWASIASQPAKVAQPKSLKSKIAGSNSVLSSAKHLAAVSLDSSLESKNGINPAIKSSVSAAATSLQRSSVPPPVSKVPAVPASLKLDLLGEESLESSRISWPAVNASINLTLDDPPLKESVNNQNNYNNNSNNRPKKDDSYQPPSHRDYRDPLYKDHNHNQGGTNSKMVNAYQPPHSRDSWNRNRNDQRDYRIRRDSDRRGDTSDSEKQNDDRNDNSRDSFSNSRRDYKQSGGARINSFRTGNGGEDRDNQFRERERDLNNKRGAMLDRNDHRGGDGYQNSRFSTNNRYEARDSQNILHSNQPPVSANRQSSAVENHLTQHHHYNNIRDGNTAGNSLSKLDLNLHPHLNPANFNPKNFNLEPVDARYFIIKSYSEDDIHRSIKYSIWCSTNHGNKRLDEAYRQQQAKNGPLYLFFSVNGSGHFCGMAQMMSSVDFDSSSGVWAQSKWQGEFSVKWLYVKDVPNSALRHITLENNEDKPVTNSRDTQEVPSEKGKAVLRIIHQYSHITSLFDDFLHYERRQEEEKLKKSHQHQPQAEPVGNHNRSEDREPQHQRGSTGRFGNRPFTRSTHNERASRFAT